MGAYAKGLWVAGSIMAVPVAIMQLPGLARGRGPLCSGSLFPSPVLVSVSGYSLEQHNRRASLATLHILGNVSESPAPAQVLHAPGAPPNLWIPVCAEPAPGALGDQGTEGGLLTRG